MQATERKTLSIDELIQSTADYNPRKISKEELEKLKNSIKKFGYVELVIFNQKTNTIVGGHQRLKALKELGYTEVECVIGNWSEAEEKELNIALNKISGEWDEDRLSKLLLDIKETGGELEATGFDDKEINKLLLKAQSAEVEEDDFDAEAAAANITEPVTKPGDLWKLGRHSLLCGDSTKLADVERLMSGAKADMVFTDPPYGMFLDTDYSQMKSNLSSFKNDKGIKGGKKYDKVIGDNLDFKAELITTIFKAFGYCKEIFLWGADYYAELLEGKNDGSWVVWDKRLDDSADKMFGSCFELCWSKQRHKRDICRIKWAGVFGTEKEFDKRRHHPTQKPALLSGWFLSKFSGEEAKIADLYGGSGSTLIACEQLNRTCYMMELDPKYCDVIVQRWEKLTGQKAVLVG